MTLAPTDAEAMDTATAIDLDRYRRRGHSHTVTQRLTLTDGDTVDTATLTDLDRYRDKDTEDTMNTVSVTDPDIYRHKGHSH